MKPKKTEILEQGHHRSTENVTWFLKIVTQFPKYVIQFHKNVIRFPEKRTYKIEKTFFQGHIFGTIFFPVFIVFLA